ncbi:lactonase family protein [Sphingomonas faeni]|uniref:lactonase family protein n=1 Tax=Sphingomonas faeni TaxID=185950 RepID=UPI00334556B6
MIEPEAPSAQTLFCWIGTYAGGGGRGLYPLRDTGEGVAIGPPDVEASNASFGTWSSRFGLQYLVDEREQGMIGAYRRTEATWIRLTQATTDGAAPCHVALDATQSWLAVANYMSGSTALYRLDEAGLPIAPPFVQANRGSGPNLERQQTAHAHWVGFGPDNRTLYVADLGTDEIQAFPFDADRGILGPAYTAFAASPGSGPRHMLFHPRHPRTAYLACELTSALVVLDLNDDGLRERATVPTLPSAWQGANIVAHIGANAAGDRLYISNRGHESIAVFALDAHGNATPIQHVASGGLSPRFFMILEAERRMIVVHERDHRVTVLDILPDGTLAPTSLAVTVPGAAFAFVS